MSFVLDKPETGITHNLLRIRIYGTEVTAGRIREFVNKRLTRPMMRAINRRLNRHNAVEIAELKRFNFYLR